MRIRNNNPLDLEGDNGERINVQIAAIGTVSAVAFDVDGNAGNFNGFTPFTLNRAIADPSLLVMFFTFSNPTGGVYRISVSGSNGGDIAHHTVAQLFGEPDNAVAFTFNVV